MSRDWTLLSRAQSFGGVPGKGGGMDLLEQLDLLWLELEVRE